MNLEQLTLEQLKVYWEIKESLASDSTYKIMANTFKKNIEAIMSIVKKTVEESKEETNLCKCVRSLKTLSLRKTTTINTRGELTLFKNASKYSWHYNDKEILISSYELILLWLTPPPCLFQ
jgi:hypothetical protein